MLAAAQAAGGCQHRTATGMAKRETEAGNGLNQEGIGRLSRPSMAHGACRSDRLSIPLQAVSKRENDVSYPKTVAFAITAAEKSPWACAPTWSKIGFSPCRLCPLLAIAEAFRIRRCFSALTERPGSFDYVRKTVRVYVND